MLGRAKEAMEEGMRIALIFEWKPDVDVQLMIVLHCPKLHVA